MRSVDCKTLANVDSVFEQPGGSDGSIDCRSMRGGVREKSLVCGVLPSVCSISRRDGGKGGKVGTVSFSNLFAFNFILRLRMKSNLFKHIKFKYGDNIVSVFRKLDKLRFKNLKINADIKFLTDCVDNDVLPKFLNFKLSNNLLKKSKCYVSCKKLLK